LNTILESFAYVNMQDLNPGLSYILMDDRVQRGCRRNCWFEWDKQLFISLWCSSEWQDCMNITKVLQIIMLWDSDHRIG